MQMNTNMNMSKERGNFLFDTELLETFQDFCILLEKQVLLSSRDE